MMSRHTLKPIKPEHDDYEIVIGWDDTLRSFFREVRRPLVADSVFGGEVVLSIVSLAEREDRAFKKVITAISEYATVDGDLSAALWSDSEKAA
jgi:hypothetical protein